MLCENIIKAERLIEVSNLEQLPFLTALSSFTILDSYIEMHSNGFHVDNAVYRIK